MTASLAYGLEVRNILMLFQWKYYCINNMYNAI
jgi:hypothetical protein